MQLATCNHHKQQLYISLLENHLFDSINLFLCNNIVLIKYHTGCAFTRII